MVSSLEDRQRSIVYEPNAQSTVDWLEGQYPDFRDQIAAFEFAVSRDPEECHRVDDTRLYVQKLYGLNRTPRIRVWFWFDEETITVVEVDSEPHPGLP